MLYWLLLSPILLLAQQPVAVISSPEEYYEGLNKYVQIWEEQGEVAYEKVLDGSYDQYFQQMPDSTNRLKPKAVYWAKITIDHQIDQDVEWVLTTGQNNYVDIYILSESGEVTHKKSGFFHTISEKDMPEGRNGEVTLLLKRRESKTVYIRASDIAAYPVRFDLSLSPVSNYHQEVYQNNIREGFVAGALIIMSLYNLLFFFLSRDKAYGYYTGYIFFSALYYLNRAGFTKAFLLPDSVILWQSMWVYAIALSPVFYLLFMREFMHTAKEIPMWDKVYKWAIRLMLLFLAVQLGIFYTAFNLTLVVNIALIQSGLSYLFLLISLVGIYSIKNTLSKYFILGSLALWAGVVIGLFVLLVIDNRNGGGFVPYGQAGVIGEIVLFSLGLGYRVRKSEEDKLKAQEGLIVQLKENEELQTKVNRELEGKVQERTAELDAQKEELAAQRDNIEKAYTEISGKNELIEKKNQDITASINYAKRIQTAILPSSSRIKESMSDAFVLFLPRDIVSGDFYWNADLDDWQVLAAVDCTGHGVPGAIMSMIGNDLLNEAIHLQKLRDPAGVLHYMDIHLKDRLQQEEGTSVKDGMDLSLCFINKINNEILFAGAKSSLVYIENGDLHEIKGDKRAIGGHAKTKKIAFQTTLIRLSPGTACYLFSDGFQDQFGGNEGRKFMKVQMKYILSELHQKPMDQQKKDLHQVFIDWKGEHQQIDDVLVMGFRL